MRSDIFHAATLTLALGFGAALANLEAAWSNHWSDYALAVGSLVFLAGVYGSTLRSWHEALEDALAEGGGLCGATVPDDAGGVTACLKDATEHIGITARGRGWGVQVCPEHREEFRSLGVELNGSR